MRSEERPLSIPQALGPEHTAQLEPSPPTAASPANANQGPLLRYLPLFVLLPLAGFALAPLVRGPMFASADGLLHLYRLVEFDGAIRGGVWYPRWAPDLLAGYGYPIFIFYAPLVYYLAEAFHTLGLSFVDALKATVAAGMLASAAGMYLFARALWGRWGGFLAAAAYLYAPYRLVNTYLDGELAQTLAWAWLPWLAWACWRYLRTRSIRYGALATVCYAGLITTHSVSSWLASLFLGLALLAALLCRAARVVDVLKLGAFMMLGAGLAAPYWLPALAEQSNVQLDRVRIATYDFHTNLLPLARTLALTWTHQYDQYVGANGPAQLGLIQVLAAIAGLAAALFVARAKGRLGSRTAALFAVLALAAFVLILQPAAVFWERTPFGRFLQFPDRLLWIMAFSLALLSGALAGTLERVSSRAAASCAMVAAALLVFGATARLDVNYVAVPPTLGPAEVTEYEQISGALGTTAKGEFTPRWLGNPPLTSPLIETELSGRLPGPLPGGDGVQVTLERRAPEALDAGVAAARPGRAELPVAYYPGWSARVNGRDAAVRPSGKGLVAVDVPAGQSEVALRFGTTPDRRLADGLALGSGLALLALIATAAWRGALIAAFRTAAQALTLLRHALGTLTLPSPAAAGEGTLAPATRVLAATAAGALVLLAGLLLTPGKLQLERWPVQRTELVSYAGWLQFMGADVTLQGDRVHVSAAFRTGSAQSARPVIATLRMTTRETVWAVGSQTISREGWTTAVPRMADIDLPLPPGTPAGVYLLELEISMDGGRTGQEWTKLSYSTPRVGKVILGPLTLPEPVTGAPSAEAPSATDFGPLELVAWQPPAQAEQGQFVPINLWWQPKTALAADWGISLHIVDAQGQVWAGHDDQPRLGYNPTSAWAAGDLERDVQMAVLPGGMPPGEYTVLAGWYDVDSRAPVGPQNVAIGHMAVAPAAHPDARLLDIPHRLVHSFPPGLELIGYDLPATRVMAGQPLPIRLFWRAAQPPAGDYGVALSVNGQGQSLPLPATSQWRTDQLMETRLVLQTQPDWTGSGPLRVAIDGDGFDLPETVTIEAPPRLTELPPGLARPNADTLGGAVALAGYRETVEGSKLQLTLYWRAFQPLPPNLHVFAHVLDAQNQVVAQHDGVPGSGRRPTATWAAGEYVEDVHDIDLPPARRRLQLEVGLYDPASGKRLGDRLLLPLTQAG